jgi:ubiquitin C-terminal hydrolase
MVTKNIELSTLGVANAGNKEASKIDVTIDHCFEKFKKPKILDEDNMWYCNTCKTTLPPAKSQPVSTMTTSSNTPEYPRRDDLFDWLF